MTPLLGYATRRALLLIVRHVSVNEGGRVAVVVAHLVCVIHLVLNRSRALRPSRIWQTATKNLNFSPLFVDCCAGFGAPLSGALEWLGWRVNVYEKEHEPHQDPLIPGLQQQVLKDLSEAAAVSTAMGCSGLTQARERALLGVREAPEPRRPSEHPMSLPALHSDPALAKGSSILALTEPVVLP